MEARRRDRQRRQRDGQLLQASLGQKPRGALGPLQEKPELFGLDLSRDAAHGLKGVSELDRRRQLLHGALALLDDVGRGRGQEPGP